MFSLTIASNGETWIKMDFCYFLALCRIKELNIHLSFFLLEMINYRWRLRQNSEERQTYVRLDWISDLLRWLRGRPEGWFLAAELHLTLPPLVLHLTFPPPPPNLKSLPPHPIIIYLHIYTYITPYQSLFTLDGGKKILRAKKFTDPGKKKSSARPLASTINNW